MKKLTKNLMIAALAIFSSATVSAQALNERDIVVDTYVGYSLIGSVFKTYENESAATSNVSGIMPVGIRGEYMLSENFGIGLDMFYTSNKLTETIGGTDLNTFEETIYTYSFERKKFASYITMNWHLAKSNDKFDFVLTSGIGYKNTTWSTESNDPNYITDEVENAIPVSFRLGTTARYFFNDNIGANLTFSIGGPLVSAGLSARF